jgi:hypothetical protein
MKKKNKKKKGGNEEEEEEEEVKRVMRKECRDLRNHLSVGQHVNISTDFYYVLFPGTLK